MVTAAIEAEIAALDTPEERAVFLADMGLEEPGVNKLIHAAYRLLEATDLFHRRGEGSARLDHPRGRYRAAGGRRDPQRFRKGIHPRRGDELRRLRAPWAAKPPAVPPESSAWKARSMS